MSRLKNPREHDDFLNYRIKRLLALGGAPAIRLCEGRYGVARMEWRLVAAVHEGGSMSPTELVRRTGIDQARVSRSVRRLVANGIMERRVEEGGSRRLAIHLTEAGHGLYRELFPQLANINRRLMDVLDESEALALEDYLARLTERAEAILRAGGGVDVRTDRHRGGSQRHWRLSLARPITPATYPGTSSARSR
jgi:DNA-binding MarR family transcriptional regulator